MKPIDYRDAQWNDLQSRLSGLRGRIYQAWLVHGPCTTEELANRTGISILSVRPRTTELYQLGAVTLLRGQGHSGVYAARDLHALSKHFHAQCRAARDPQLALSL